MGDIQAEEALYTRAQCTTEGFAELFDAYYDRVYAYAYRRVRVRQTAEDVAGCVFEDALKGIDKTRWKGKPIIAWLLRIASRRIADHFRERKSVPFEDETLASQERHLEDTFDQWERRLEVQTALGELNAADREIIQLTYFDELEPAEISALLRISKNNVYVRHHRALVRLEKVLSGRGG